MKLLVLLGLFMNVAFASNFGTAEDAKKMVKKAVEYYNKHGMAKTMEKINKRDADFNYKDIYIFIVDRKGVIVAHGKKEALINKSLWEVADATGRFFVRDMVKASNARPDGAWTKYLWEHPVTKKEARKRSYLIQKEKLIIGSGAYVK